MSEAKLFQRKPPDRDGWWLFREDGAKCNQRILVTGSIVAYDDEWAAVMGREPSDENYWEGSDVREMTDGTLTSGEWRFESDVVMAPTAKE